MANLFRLCIASMLAAGTMLAHAASVADLLGEPLRDERGERVGKLSDFIVDVRAGRVLYLLIDAGERFYSAPVRALGEDLRVDMAQAGEIARRDAERTVRFRRASELLGDAVTHAHPGGATRVGRLADIAFDPASGRVDGVTVDTADGELALGPEVLAHRRFPPLTSGQPEYADTESVGERGFRPAPSDERRRLHDHEFR